MPQIADPSAPSSAPIPFATITPAAEPPQSLRCKHVLYPGQAHCLICGEQILFTGPTRTRWQAFHSVAQGVVRILNRRLIAPIRKPLTWWRSPIDTPVHTHCAGCGVRLSWPTLGPSCCKNCDA
jgi:hypothetical protein